MDRVQVTMRLRPTTHAKLKAMAEREHRSMAQQIEHLIERTAAGNSAERRKGAAEGRPESPGYQVVVVREGETLEQAAERLGVDLAGGVIMLPDNGRDPEISG